jgi:hypothetical protein
MQGSYTGGRTKYVTSFVAASDDRESLRGIDNIIAVSTQGQGNVTPTVMMGLLEASRYHIQYVTAKREVWTH